MGITPLFSQLSDRHRMAFLEQDNCLTNDELLATNNNNQQQADADPKNCMKLNAAPQYFDGGLVRINSTGTFYYMSTRNNNFSNRSQKGSMMALPIIDNWAVGVVVVGAVLCLGSLGVGWMMVEAKRNPMSRWAQTFDRM